MRAGIVLSRRHIAGAARAINLLYTRSAGRALAACEPWKIRRHFTCPVVTHGMNRIETQGSERLIARPKTQRLEPRINQTFTCLNRGWITCAAHAIKVRASVRCLIAPIGSNLGDFRLTRADVCHRPCPCQALTQSSRDSLNRSLME